MKLEVTLAIIEVLLRYGPQAVVDIALLWDKDPTPDQIRSLYINKKPEEYFQ
jgi:hypothetical protein